MTSDKIDCMVCKSPTLMEKSEGSVLVPHISLHVCSKHFIYCQCVDQELTLVSLVIMGLAMGEAVGEGGGIPVAKRTNVQCWWRRVWAIPISVAKCSTVSCGTSHVTTKQLCNRFGGYSELAV